MLVVGKGKAHGLADCRLRSHVQSSLGGDVQRAPAPLLETSLSAPDFIFLEASNALGGIGVVQDCACQASSSPPMKGEQWVSPFPRALRCRIRGSDSHLFIRRLCAFKVTPTRISERQESTVMHSSS